MLLVGEIHVTAMWEMEWNMRVKGSERNKQPRSYLITLENLRDWPEQRSFENQQKQNWEGEMPAEQLTQREKCVPTDRFESFRRAFDSTR